MSNHPAPAISESSNTTAPDAAVGDLWPTLVEFAVSLRLRWIDVCSSLDLTAAQGGMLKQLRFGTPVPMSALAGMMACDASNVTGIVDKLESRGLLVRQGDESDRRVKMLVMTEKGRELQERIRARFSCPPAPIDELPADLRERMSDALRGVMATWTRTRTSASNVPTSSLPPPPASDAPAR